MEWNESNFDCNRHPYLKWCFDNKKWAYLSDLVRLLVVYEYGGIYFDTDVELLKNPHEMLHYDSFLGRENGNYIATGVGFGAIPNHPFVKEMIEQYNNLKIDSNGNFIPVGCPILNTKALIPFGLELYDKLQIIDNNAILPVKMLNPYNPVNGVMNITDETLSIHWYSHSSLTPWQVYRVRLLRPIRRIISMLR